MGKHAKSLQKPTLVSVASTSDVADLSAEAMEREIVYVPKADDFASNWAKKREKKGAAVINPAKMLCKELLVLESPPLTLTILGHGRYYDSGETMLDFLGTKNEKLVKYVADLLEEHPSIKRLNLYGCKSGLTPLLVSQQAFAERVNYVSDRVAKYRLEEFQLSYAEYFILRLREALGEDAQERLAGLKIVACLGDVKDNSGKVGISGHTRAHCVIADPFAVVDTKTSLIEINCSKFLVEYDRCCKGSVVEAAITPRSRIRFFESPAGTPREADAEVISRPGTPHSVPSFSTNSD